MYNNYYTLFPYVFLPQWYYVNVTQVGKETFYGSCRFWTALIKLTRKTLLQPISSPGVNCMHGGDGMFIRIKFQVNPFILIHLGLKSTPFFCKRLTLYKAYWYCHFVLHSSRLPQGNYALHRSKCLPSWSEGEADGSGRQSGNWN